MLPAKAVPFFRGAEKWDWISAEHPGRGTASVAPLSATLPQDMAQGAMWSRTSAARDRAYSTFPLCGADEASAVPAYPRHACFTVLRF